MNSLKMRDSILYDHFSKSPYFLPAQMKNQEKGKLQHLLVLQKFHYKKQSPVVASSNTVKLIVLT